MGTVDGAVYTAIDNVDAAQNRDNSAVNFPLEVQ